MRVVPAPGRAVRDPRTLTLLTDDGRDVDETDVFWARRLRDGDVVEQGSVAAHRAQQPDARREA